MRPTNGKAKCKRVKSDAVSDADIIEEIMGQEMESEDDDSDNEQQTEISKKPDIKDVMDAISIIEY